MSPSLHQYIDRKTNQVQTERFYGDRLVNYLYSSVRERAPVLFKALTSATISHLVGFWNYDTPLSAKISGASSFAKRLGIDLTECVDDPNTFETARKVFERKIRYWETRPLEPHPRTVVSPADAKVLIGSLKMTSHLFLKGKFFDFHELLGRDKEEWHQVFHDGDFAIFRLTPEQYHYNHTPVAGRVVDFYEVDGTYHSCNPGPTLFMATPYSKNKRVVTIMDTDVPGGTQVGYVAMIEIVALMIGTIVQCYSEEQYDHPQPIEKGMFLKKGQPKSLYRPGSSTDVLFFQKHRIQLSRDLQVNQHRQDAVSRYSLGLGRPAIETAVSVRSTIGLAQKVAD